MAAAGLISGCPYRLTRILDHSGYGFAQGAAVSQGLAHPWWPVLGDDFSAAGCLGNAHRLLSWSAFTTRGQHHQPWPLHHRVALSACDWCQGIPVLTWDVVATRRRRAPRGRPLMWPCESRWRPTVRVSRHALPETTRGGDNTRREWACMGADLEAGWQWQARGPRTAVRSRVPSPGGRPSRDIVLKQALY